jgi:succinate dehydrogenase membrane anchor subunit
MIETGSTPKQGETTFLWLVKIVTGPILLIVATIHLIVNHYIGSLGGLQTYSDVVKYYKAWYIPAMEAIFLVTVLAHSLIGLRGIILDLRPSATMLKLVNWVFAILGIGFSAYGLWLLIVIAGR